ncbi:translation initiation factor IF-2-like [Prionailurus bengalensis]|uniref:translation initiation factor IF-2-like n=1 Tax=Prionailurus bengalensis TaxID=37029 RepID=UPI001CAA0F2E|nr:translation initiation factor IF-2-like [Prionailurus bengalensis]
MSSIPLALALAPPPEASLPAPAPNVLQHLPGAPGPPSYPDPRRRVPPHCPRPPLARGRDPVPTKAPTPPPQPTRAAALCPRPVPAPAPPPPPPRPPASPAPLPSGGGCGGCCPGGARGSGLRFGGGGGGEHVTPPSAPIGRAGGRAPRLLGNGKPAPSLAARPLHAHSAVPESASQRPPAPCRAAACANCAPGSAQGPHAGGGLMHLRADAYNHAWALSWYSILPASSAPY